MTSMNSLSRNVIADRAYRDQVWKRHSPTAPPADRIPTSYMEAVHKQLGMQATNGLPPDPGLAESMLRARPELAHDHEALLALGLALARQGKHDEALATYATADRHLSPMGRPDRDQPISEPG